MVTLWWQCSSGCSAAAVCQDYRHGELQTQGTTGTGTTDTGNYRHLVLVCQDHNWHPPRRLIRLAQLIDQRDDPIVPSENHCLFLLDHCRFAQFESFDLRQHSQSINLRNSITVLNLHRRQYTARTHAAVHSIQGQYRQAALVHRQYTEDTQTLELMKSDKKLITKPNTKAPPKEKVRFIARKIHWCQ